MPLFRFCPTDFRRQYVFAADRAALLEQADDLFASLVADSFFWLTDDDEDKAYREELRRQFDQGLSQAEASDLTFIDSHY